MGAISQATGVWVLRIVALVLYGVSENGHLRKVPFGDEKLSMIEQSPMKIVLAVYFI